MGRSQFGELQIWKREIYRVENTGTKALRYSSKEFLLFDRGESLLSFKIPFCFGSKESYCKRGANWG